MSVSQPAGQPASPPIPSLPSFARPSVPSPFDARIQSVAPAHTRIRHHRPPAGRARLPRLLPARERGAQPCRAPARLSRVPARGHTRWEARDDDLRPLRNNSGPWPSRRWHGMAASGYDVAAPWRIPRVPSRKQAGARTGWAVQAPPPPALSSSRQEQALGARLAGKITRPPAPFLTSRGRCLKAARLQSLHVISGFCLLICSRCCRRGCLG